MRIPRTGPAGRSGTAVAARLLTGGVFALAGLLFATSFHTARGTDLRNDAPLLRLPDLVRQKNRHNEQLEKELSADHRAVDGLTDRAARDPGGDHRLAAAGASAGTRPLTGPAVSVTLTDAPPDAKPRVPDVPDPAPDDLVIHQQDLQAVVNALWRGGAKGIKVMDQRLIATSAVRCVGNTLILQGRVYSPPYTITAVGDQSSLHRAVNKDPDIQNYLQYVQAYGLGWKVKDMTHTTLPGYTGTVRLRYAKPER